MKRIIFTLALLSTTAGALHAQTAPSKVSTPSVAGEWDASMNTPGAQVSFKLVFKVKGDTLTGTVKRASGDVPLTGRVKGDSVVFQYTIQYNENPFTMNLRGQVRGDSLGGIVDFGGVESSPFSAKRVGKP